MLKQNKNSIYSFSFLVLTIAGYINLENLSSYDFLDNPVVSKFDWFVYTFTKYQWDYASLDIALYLSMSVPFILLACSVVFGIKALRSPDAISPKLRMLGLISLIISSFILVTFIVLGIMSWAGLW